MIVSDKHRYKIAFLSALAIHVVGFVLIILLGMILSMPSDEVIEVTLASGDVNVVTQTTPETQQQKHVEQQEQKYVPKTEDEIFDFEKKQQEIVKSQEKRKKQAAQKFVNENDHKSISNHLGDGGNDEYTSMPKVIKIVKPIYPPAARNMDKQGTVRVKLLISSKGVVEKAEIINSGGYAEFDEAVLKAVYMWRFVAAKNKFGRYCACNVVVPIKFELK